MSVEMLQDLTSRQNMPSRLFTEQGKRAWLAQQEQLATMAREVFAIISKENPHISRFSDMHYDQTLVKEAIWCLLYNKHIEVTPDFRFRAL